MSCQRQIINRMMVARTRTSLIVLQKCTFMSVSYPETLVELHEPEIDSIKNPSPVELQVDAHQSDQEHDAKQGEDKRAGVFVRLRSSIDASIYAKCANGQ